MACWQLLSEQPNARCASEQWLFPQVLLQLWNAFLLVCLGVHNLRVCKGRRIGCSVVAFVVLSGIDQAFGRLWATLATGHVSVATRMQRIKVRVASRNNQKCLRVVETAAQTGHAGKARREGNAVGKARREGNAVGKARREGNAAGKARRERRGEERRRAEGRGAEGSGGERSGGEGRGGEGSGEERRGGERREAEGRGGEGRWVKLPRSKLLRVLKHPEFRCSAILY